MSHQNFPQYKAPTNYSGSVHHTDAPHNSRGFIIDDVHVHSSGTIQTQQSPSFFSAVKNCLFSAVFGVVIGAVGTAVHRGGIVSSFAWGIVLALALVLASGYVARGKWGRLGSVIFGTALMTIVQVLAMVGPGGDYLILGAAVPGTPEFAGIVGTVWMYGSAAISVIYMLLPARIFALSPATPRR